MKYKRIFVIVMDSVGIGEAPDAAHYGDEGAHTLGNISKNVENFHIPNLEKLGIGNLSEMERINPINNNLGYYAKAQEISLGKDTLTGHWELMGLNVTEPFKTFTDTGFPKELLDELTARTGRKIIGNKSASGTAILDELGEEHMETGAIIVYTSADSVLQIAAHEEIVPIEELWNICKIAREITMKEEWKVGRIIARPFIGSGKGNFERTANRHDYAVKPFADTVLNKLENAEYDVISLGKINDIYAGEGITEYEYTTSNDNGMEKLLACADKEFKGLCFLNLVDFDAKFGHRRNPLGYGQALMDFDKQLGEFLDKMLNDDLVIITADHGNDPTAHGTDHTREFVPVLSYSKSMRGNGEISDLLSFACVGATIADNFGVKLPEIGYSFLEDLK